jgi:NAD(P)H dehydrogenase (quinone)
VTGASGKLGRRVLELLRDRDYDGRIIGGSRTPEAVDLPGIEARKVDFEDAASLPAAFAGVDRLLIISTDKVGARLDAHRAAITAAGQAGVKEVIYTSMPNPEPPSAITFAPDHHGTEQAIKASGLPYTILRMSWYADNLLGSLPGNLATGQWFTSTAGGKVGYVTREDCARAAAGALLMPAENGTYTVTGPETLSVAEIARIASDVAGEPLTVIDVTDAELAAGAKAAGVADYVIEHFIVALERNTREGKMAMATDAVETLWGEKPMSLRDFLEANRRALLGQAQAA